jgi:large repetitive protein
MIATLSAPPDWFGNEYITLAVSDGVAPPVSDNILVIVNPVNDPPQIDLPGQFTFLEDTSLLVDFSAYISDIDSNQFIISIDTTENLYAQIIGLNAIFTATQDWNGTASITVNVSDLDGGFASDDMDIIVIPVNDPPHIVVQIPDPFIVDEDFDPVTINLDDYYDDVDGDALSYDVDFVPAHVLIELNGSLATISPVENWFGETEISITVSDGQARAQISDTFTLLVNPVNDLPEINLPDEIFFNEDGTLIFDASLYCYDIEGHPLTISLSGNTEITAEITGLTIIFSATPDWFGSETITITVDDQQGRPADDMIVTVLPVNDPPVLIAFEPVETEFDTLQYSTVHFQVEVTDIDSELDYLWRINGVTLDENSALLQYQFNDHGTFTIRSIVSDEDYSISTVWTVFVEETENDEPQITPAVTELLGNYPNPFNPITNLNFSVSKEQNIRIDVYNLKGQMVRNLTNCRYPLGMHSITWDSKDNYGKPQPSGIYYFRLISLDKTDTSKALLLK